MRVYALKTDVALNDIKSTEFILREMGKTERNFRRDKNQTTTEIERYRIEKENTHGVARIMEKISLIIEKLKPK